MLKEYIALDIETTGVNPAEDKIIEIGMARINCGEIEERYSRLINPQVSICERVQELTGITDEMVNNQPLISEVISEVIDFTKDLPILGHNIMFDYSFIKKAAVNSRLNFEKKGLDTLKISRRLLPELPKKGLEFLMGYFGIDPGHSHRALDDAISAAKLYEKLEEISIANCNKGLDEDELFDLVYSVKKDSPITAAQKKYLSALILKHKVMIPEDVEVLTKSKASRYIDQILSQYGK